MNKVFVALAFLSLPVVLAPAALMPAYAATLTELGDLSALSTIATDTLSLVGQNDMVAAAVRITDYETAWDADAAKLRALSAAKWGVIDDASDKAIKALRAGQPSTAEATAAVTALVAALDNPAAPAAPAGPATAVTDANGRPLPCEDMLASVRAAASATVPEAEKAALDELTNKGIERCNADDDKRADSFFAQALGLTGK